MTNTYDKDKIKQSLTIEQVFDLVAELGGEPRMQNNFFIAKTICHNGESHKLYYYDNTKLFHCYTECEPPTFDIFELIMKVKKINLYMAIIFVINFFGLGISINEFENTEGIIIDDYWDILSKYKNNLQIDQKQIVEMQTYDDSFLQNLPHPRIIEWEQEGIKPEIIQKRGIAYDPKNEGIVIPHYNIDGKLVGVRERTLIQEEEKNGKYKPAIINNKMYNHPLSFNLYNLNNSKNSIKILKKVIVFESEKSCLKYASFFGEDNDISVAVCGSSLIQYQVNLLLSLGIQELIVAFDKQFKELNDEEHKKWCKKLTNIYNKYHSIVQISYLFDKEHILDYKMSPIDAGPATFMTLFNNRIFL